MKYLLANWKANTDLANFSKLVQMVPEGASQVMIFPPAPYIWPLSRILPHQVGLGAQDVSCEQGGAFTGEVTAKMLAEVGVGSVLLGHSERRVREGMAEISQKLTQAISENLLPVICCGWHDVSDDAVLFDILLAQIPDLDGLEKALIAYEPVFAIGTGEVAGVEHIDKVLKKLAHALRTRYPKLEISLLYGGSVNADNISQILDIPDCSGVLVGSASMQPTQWEEMIKSCKTYS